MNSKNISLFKRLSIPTFFLIFTLACAFLNPQPSPTPLIPSPVFPTRTTPETTFPPGSLTPTVPLTPSKDTSFLGLLWDDNALYTPGIVASQQERSIGLRGATVYHIEMTIDEKLTHVSGREELRYTNNETEALDQLWLRLYPNIIGGQLTVSNVNLAKQTVQPQLDMDDSLLILPLDPPLQPGESVVLGMDFEITVPTDATTNYGVFASIDGVLTLAHAYPMVAVYDETGWNAEIPAGHGDLTYADAAYFAVRVVAPKDVTLIASGRQVTLENGEKTQTALFALGPGRDFMLTAAQDYTVRTQAVGETTVNVYTPANADSQSTLTSLETTVNALQTFSRRYAPYPYTELDVVATPTFALGVEYPGLIAISARLYEPGAPPSYLESTVAHETGHQWFYNLVGDDQLDQPWLDESLTQFITWQYFDDRYGESGSQGFKSSLTGRWEGVDNQPIPVGKPVADYSDREYSAIVYGRGALFFFALRDEMGQEAFDVFLHTYTVRHSWGIATTDGLKESAEQTCGCDLNSLFEQWIYSK